MSERPWFKFYMSDWRDGTRGLTWEEAGVYVHLLSLMYEKGGPIDDDPHWICRLIGGTARSWNRVRDALVETGKITTSDGKISNPRAEREEFGCNPGKKFGRSFGEVSLKLPGNLDRVSNENKELSAATRARVQNPDLSVEINLSSKEERDLSLLRESQRKDFVTAPSPSPSKRAQAPIEKAEEQISEIVAAALQTFPPPAPALSEEQRRAQVRALLGHEVLPGRVVPGINAAHLSPEELAAKEAEAIAFINASFKPAVQ